MPASPLITIGIPVYNGEQFLGCAIEAALNQSYQNLEVCISDNASTDSSRKIAESWAARDPRVRLEVQPLNRGAAWNFNRVAEMARGDYFKWLASDDLMAPSYVEKCVALLEADPGLTWVHSGFSRIDSSVKSFSQPIAQWSPSSSLPEGDSAVRRDSPRASQRFRSVLLGSNWLNDNYGLIRLSQLRRTRLELPYYGSEKILLAELSLLGRFAEVPEVLHYVREHDSKSGRLGTAVEQQRFTDPESRQGAWGIRWGLLSGFWTAISRYPLSTSERIRCRWSLLGYTLQWRKWPHVLKQVLTGRAVQGAENATGSEVEMLTADHRSRSAG